VPIDRGDVPDGVVVIDGRIPTGIDDTDQSAEFVVHILNRALRPARSRRQQGKKQQDDALFAGVHGTST
jgi:hypothetical protein